MLRKITMTAAGIAVVATVVLAGSHAGPFDAAVTARQSQMRLHGFNIGILGAMAKGEAEYDAEAASAAAGNLVALASIIANSPGYWPEGSDSDSIEGTRALPAIWEDMAGVGAKAGAFAEAATAMDAVAGNGLEALQGAIGPLGGSCGGCHETYQKPRS